MSEHVPVGWRALSRLTAELLARISMFVFFLAIARTLGPSATGNYATVFSFLTLFVFITDFGLNLATVREVSRNSGNLKFIRSRLIPFRVGLLVLYTLVTLVLSSWWNWNPSEKALVVPVIAFLALNSLLDALYHVFQSIDRQVDESILKVIQRVGVAIAGIAGLWLTGDLAYSITLAAAVQLLVAMISTVRLNRLLKPYLRSDLKPDTNYSALVHLAWPLGLSAFLTVIYLRIDVVMMQQAGLGADVIGRYQAAARVHDFLHTVSVLAFGTLVPDINRFFHSGRRSFSVWMNRSVRLLSIWTVLVVTLTWLVGDAAFQAVFGIEFSGTAAVARLLFIGLIPMGINLVLLHFLLFSGRTRFGLLATGISTGVNVAGNWFLIPLAGATGAAISTVLSETILFVLLISIIPASQSLRWQLRWIPSLGLVVIVCIVFATIFNELDWWVLVMGLLPVIATSVVLLGLVNRHDRFALLSKKRIHQEPDSSSDL